MAACCGRSCRGRCQPLWWIPSESLICMLWGILSSRPFRHPKPQQTGRTTPLAHSSRGRCKISGKETWTSVIRTKWQPSRVLRSVQGLMGRSSGLREMTTRRNRLMAREGGSRGKSSHMRKCSTEPAAIIRLASAVLRSYQHAVRMDGSDVQR